MKKVIKVYEEWNIKIVDEKEFLIFLFFYFLDCMNFLIVKVFSSVIKNK